MHISIFYLSAVADCFCHLLMPFVWNVLFISIHGDHHRHHHCDSLDRPVLGMSRMLPGEKPQLMEVNLETFAHQ